MSKIRDTIKKWIFGGESKDFMLTHEKEICEYNIKAIRIVSFVDFIALATALVFIRISRGGISKVIFISFFPCMLLTLVVFLYTFFRKKEYTIKQIKILLSIALLCIAFSIIGYELYGTKNICVFTPMFFAVIGVVFVVPMYYQIILYVTVIALFIVLEVNLRPNLSALDIYDTCLGAFVGILIGGEILRSRMAEIKSYSHIVDSIKEENEIYTRTMNAATKEYMSVFYLNLLKATVKTVYMSDQLLEKYGEASADGEYNTVKNIYIEKSVIERDREIFRAFSEIDYIREQLADNKSFSFTYSVKGPNGPELCRAYYMSLAPEGDSEGIALAFENVNTQVLAEAKTREKLREARNRIKLAEMDALTGVEGRHFFEKKRNEINEKIKNGEFVEFSVIVCDINNLKETNDIHGHDEGDKLIKSVADIISEVFDGNKVSRIGGDEFAVVLEGDSYKKSEELFNTLKYTEKTKGVSVANGIATYDARTDSSFSDVFSRADNNMYVAKRETHAGGKN